MGKHVGIILLGLGPGNPKQVTREAWAVLNEADEVYLRTNRHPVVASLPATLTVHSFDDLYEKTSNFDDVYAQIVEQVMELAKRPQGVVYAVPGHPFVAEATSREIATRAKDLQIPVKLVQGLSFVEPALAALELDLLPQTTIVDALDLLTQHHPLFPPSAPALVAQLYSQQVAAEVKLTLMAAYPDDHSVHLIHAAGTSGELVESVPLHAMDRSPKIGVLTALYVPAISPHSSFEELQELIAHLRSPEGCPWDREQTHLALRRNLLEETYGVLAALDSEDVGDMQEEFGDLLIQIVLHAQIAAEAGEFTMSDVIRGVYTKLIDRHPHVFGDLELGDAEAVIDNWEHLKAEEREAKGDTGRGLLDGVANALPALTQAESYGSRAARVGFEWPNIAGVLEKIDEEIVELCQAKEPTERRSEFGDLLFALVNLARWLDLDPEVALREANARFKNRFAYVESSAVQQGKSLKEMSLEEMEALWQHSKSNQ